MKLITLKIFIIPIKQVARSKRLVAKVMKEQGYEYYGSSLKENLGIGANCVWTVGEQLYQAMKPVVEYRIRDALHQRNRVTWQDLRRRGMF